MDIAAAVEVGKSLVELVHLLSVEIEGARRASDVPTRVLKYLDVIQGSVALLGLERQRILTEARRCNLALPDQSEALFIRLDRYLHEDNVRPHLEAAIAGLHACREPIESEAASAWWRKRDKAAAARNFVVLLERLTSQLTMLKSNFYPGGSGMGVQTLKPIYDLAKQARDSVNGKAMNPDFDELNESLIEKVILAMNDPSHEQWMVENAKIESLTVQMELAFSVLPGTPSANEAKSSGDR